MTSQLIARLHQRLERKHAKLDLVPRRWCLLWRTSLLWRSSASSLSSSPSKIERIRRIRGTARVSWSLASVAVRECARNYPLREPTCECLPCILRSRRCQSKPRECNESIDRQTYFLARANSATSPKESPFEKVLRTLCSGKNEERNTWKLLPLLSAIEFKPPRPDKFPLFSLQAKEMSEHSIASSHTWKSRLLKI